MNSPDPGPQPFSKLAILVWAATPDRPELCAMPFVYAAVAAAMDCEVEIHFAGPAVRLLVEGVASGLYADTSEKTVYDFMQEAAGLGARFLACSMAARQFLRAEDKKIAEFSGTHGAATFIMRNLDPEWKGMIF